MARAATDIIREYNGGKFAEEFTETVNLLVGSVVRTGKKGKLQLNIELTPSKSSAPAVQIRMDLIDKSPDFDRPAEFMYVTATNDLVRNHPNQQALQLEEVGALGLPRGQVVDPLTGEIITTAAAR